jgi:hypothetical protein
MLSPIPLWPHPQKQRFVVCFVGAEAREKSALPAKALRLVGNNYC